MSANAVANVTEAIANVTLADTAAPSTGAITADSDKSATASPNEAVIASAAEGRRLYIGNLAYATTEGELKEFFKDFPIESTSIPVNPRTSRPVGYAFVDLKTPEDAARAITELSGKEILERKVSVQLARKPEAAGEKGEDGANGDARRRAGRGRGRGRSRGGRNARGGRVNGEGVPGQAAPLSETTNEALNAEAGAANAAGFDDAKPKPRGPRRQRGPPEDGVPSKTKIMVANLPYDLTEDKLKDLFVDYEPSSAKIALRPIPRFMIKKLQSRNEPRKGRGFGFVTLGSEELQQKAVAEMNGKEIEGREIAVKVAIDSPGKEDAETGKTDLKENGVGDEHAAEGAAAAAEAAPASTA